MKKTKCKNMNEDNWSKELKPICDNSEAGFYSMFQCK